jgi:hypothetical protein
MVEAVLAMAVLAMMGTALIGSYSFGFLAMGLTRENQRATQILLEKVETLRLYRWDQLLTPGFIPSSFSEAYDPQAPAGSQGAIYTGTLSIGPVPFTSDYSTNMREIDITLQWTNANNLAHTRRVTTYVAKDGLQNYVY